MTATLCLLAVLATWAPAAEGEGNTVMSQDITIHGKGAKGPNLPKPPMMPEQAIFDEVLDSLNLQSDKYQEKRPERKPRRLTRLFPAAPYLLLAPKMESLASKDPWTFEVLAGDRILKRYEGKGPKAEMGWDGTDMNGEHVAKTEEPYTLRFTFEHKGQRISHMSDPFLFGSMDTSFGPNRHLEVSTALLFKENEAIFGPTALDYLAELSARLRQIDPKNRPYLFVLYEKKADSDLAKTRANVLTRFFSKQLLVPLAKISIEVQPIGERGPVLAFLQQY